MCNRIVTIEPRICHHKWEYVPRLDVDVCVKCHGEREHVPQKGGRRSQGVR